jgi:hypothetical protein
LGEFIFEKEEETCGEEDVVIDHFPYMVEMFAFEGIRCVEYSCEHDRFIVVGTSLQPVLDKFEELWH